MENTDREQDVIRSLCQKLEIPEFRSGNITIRDERNWRINEKYIDYCWLINVSKSFIGWCWLFTIKYNATKFREKNNPDELVQGVFNTHKDGTINQFTSVTKNDNMVDKVKNLKLYDLYDLYDANPAIVLDGVSYLYLIFAKNTKIIMDMNNPHSKNWQEWEKEVNSLGRQLTFESNIQDLKMIFH